MSETKIWFYCPACGSDDQVEFEEVIIAPDSVVIATCPNCGATFAVTMKFCAVVEVEK